MKRLTKVLVHAGFWRGCAGFVVGKFPLLPLYRVCISHRELSAMPPTTTSMLLLELPKSFWFWGFQMVNIDKVEKPIKLTEKQMVEKCLAYIVEHDDRLLTIQERRILSTHLKEAKEPKKEERPFIRPME
jgi:hypothetical protein